MGQCYGKPNSTAGNHHDLNTTAANEASGEAFRSPLPSSAANGFLSAKNTPGRPSSHASPWPSPYPHGVNASPLPGDGVSPSPARGTTPRRFFRRPFPPPSPAKHIRASLVPVLKVQVPEVDARCQIYREGTRQRVEPQAQGAQVCQVSEYSRWNAPGECHGGQMQLHHLTLFALHASPVAGALARGSTIALLCFCSQDAHNAEKQTTEVY